MDQGDGLQDARSAENNENEFCPVHQGHWKRHERLLDLEAPVSREDTCSASKEVTAFRNILSKVTREITGEALPISLVELSYLLSFPFTPCSSRSKTRKGTQLDSYFHYCLGCDGAAYSTVRQSSCRANHNRTVFLSTARCYQATQTLKVKT